MSEHSPAGGSLDRCRVARGETDSDDIAGVRVHNRLAAAKTPGCARRLIEFFRRLYRLERDMPVGIPHQTLRASDEIVRLPAFVIRIPK